jgi:hypothetical protein
MPKIPPIEGYNNGGIRAINGTLELFPPIGTLHNKPV